ncbi:hypothetical protein CF328_g6248 [Tilletia controversa]|nr:hypothetical protein CF328_g6248 [Tilletia controversa]
MKTVQDETKAGQDEMIAALVSQTNQPQAIFQSEAAIPTGNEGKRKQAQALCDAQAVGCADEEHANNVGRISTGYPSTGNALVFGHFFLLLPSGVAFLLLGAGSNVAAQKQKKTKGKQATSEESSSAVAKQVELSVAITLPSSTNGAKGKSAKPISKDSMLRCAKDTEYTVFKSKVVASALNAGLSASTYDNLDIEGKIAAGGVWKDKKRLHDDEAFRSFWEKILKKKSWEAYVYVSQSPTAVIEVSSDSGPDIAPVKVEDDSTDDDEVAKSLLAAAASDLKKKRKSNEAPNVSGKRPKVVVKDEAEEARKKRSLNPSAASGPSRLRRASPFPPQASTSAAQPTQARAGPDMTFEALAKRVKLYETIVAKLLKVGVKKASAFARLTEDKLKQVGCLEGEVEEALDAQDRWRRLDAKDLKADELVDALLA